VICDATWVNHAESRARHRGNTLPEEAILILVGVLLAITIGAAIEYYKQLRKAKREYEKARMAVEDIIISVNRQFKQEADRLELVAYKVETISSKNEKTLQRMQDSDKKISELEKKVDITLEDKEKVLMKLNEIDGKTRDIVTSQETFASRLSAIEEQSRQPPFMSGANIEAVIPIKREKALAPLTETELSVLEMLSLEGSRTAPEIKSKIKLSREHTARLMKKLYEDGYLERETGKIPFKYSVKKEMEKLLKKSESEPAQSN
jgi:DNA repair exonuclease SbcCD ATPase subunit